MTNKETSSLPTLENIIERDKVDAEFRRNRLIGDIFGSTIFTGIGALTAYGMTMITIREGFDLCNIVFGIGGAVFSIGGASAIATAIKTYRNLDGSEKANEQGYYYVKGKVSKNKTVFETHYGKPIEAVSSLEDLKYDYGDKSTDDAPYRFIDHLFLEEVTTRTSKRTMEFGGPPEPMTVTSDIYSGHIKIRRFNKIIRLPYVFMTMIDKEFEELMQLASKEFSLLYKPGEYDEDADQEYPFRVEKIYYPHP